MADLRLIPSGMYPDLCVQLKRDCSTALKVLATLSRPSDLADLKCYSKKPGEKPDASIVVIKTNDERFRKFGVQQEFLVRAPSQEALGKVLENKTITDMKTIVLFRGIGNAHLEWYENLSIRHHGHFHSMFKVQLYKLKSPWKLDENLPCGAEFGPISDPQDVHRLRVSWLFREMVSSEEFARLMLSDVKVGLFLNVSRRRHLVSWAVVNAEGVIAFVTTVSGYQHKGYSKLVVSQLCRMLLEQGRIPVAEVDERNRQARQLFEELGFCRVAEQQWGFHVPDNRTEMEKFMRIFHEFTLVDQRAFKMDIQENLPPLVTNTANNSNQPDDTKQLTSPISRFPAKIDTDSQSDGKNAIPEKEEKAVTKNDAKRY